LSFLASSRRPSFDGCGVTSPFSRSTAASTAGSSTSLRIRLTSRLIARFE
jgi:hypothetical protein